VFKQCFYTIKNSFCQIQSSPYAPGPAESVKAPSRLTVAPAGRGRPLTRPRSKARPLAWRPSGGLAVRIGWALRGRSLPQGAGKVAGGLFADRSRAGGLNRQPREGDKVPSQQRARPPLCHERQPEPAGLPRDEHPPDRTKAPRIGEKDQLGRRPMSPRLVFVLARNGSAMTLGVSRIRRKPCRSAFINSRINKAKWLKKALTSLESALIIEVNGDLATWRLGDAAPGLRRKMGPAENAGAENSNPNIGGRWCSPWKKAA
jgi:hypothetical protein